MIDSMTQRINEVTVDFETESVADLKKVGTFNYANHPTTWPLCMAFKVDDGCADIWLPGQEFPEVLRQAISDGAEFHAFNASFEWHIWKFVCVDKLGWPPIPFSQWRCTRAQASYYGMPRGLDKLTSTFRMGLEGKDKEGHKAMLRICKPNKKGVWKRKQEDIEANWDYCVQDVECERTVGGKMPPLPAIEHKIWKIDQGINNRGIPVDLDLCKGAVAIIAEVERRADIACTNATKQPYGTSLITRPTQLQRIKEWCRERDVFLPDMSESTIRETLELDKDMDYTCRALLQARADCSSAAVKKFIKALNQADKNGLCKNQHDYYGAVTGRWAAKGVQFQNLRRVDPDFEVTDETIKAVKSGDIKQVEAFGSPIMVLSNHVRSMVKAPQGKAFAYADYSSIEARILSWFACDSDTLQAFRDGVCLYSKLASKIYGLPLEDIKKDSHERSVGKAGILGLGFKMGATTFQRQVKAQAGLDLDLSMCEDVVRIYREEMPNVVELWQTMETSAFMALRNPGKEISGWGWSYQTWGDWLTLKLPSGRRLFYYKAHVEAEGRYGKPEIVYNGPSGRAYLSGSVLVENLVQATARDIQANALIECAKERLPVVTHVHDSIYTLVRKAEAADAAKFLEEVMCRVPEWSRGIPIKSESGYSERVQ